MVYTSEPGIPQNMKKPQGQFEPQPYKNDDKHENN